MFRKMVLSVFRDWCSRAMPSIVIATFVLILFLSVQGHAQQWPMFRVLLAVSCLFLKP